MGSSPARRYAFGDSAAASERLGVLAAVFAPTSRALLAGLGREPATVLDLGCGPGHTSAMLAGAFPAARVLGIDTSSAFVAEAVAAAAGAGGGSQAAGAVGNRCRFTVGDVTASPLPGAPADLVYARFLVVHLPEPRAVVARWTGALAPGGAVVVEEPEAIDTADPDFRRYLELAAAVVADRGGDLYVGGRLAGLVPPAPAVVALDREAPLEVTAGQAAGIFSLNLATWGADPALSGVAVPGEVAGLLDRLVARRGDGTAGVIRWHMRQVVLTVP